MAEPDIVERLRGLAGDPGDIGMVAVSCHELAAWADEIERLRCPWTRLGPGSLPPEGVPFECRADSHPDVRMLVVVFEGRGHAIFTDGTRAETFEDPWPEEPPGGWWRLLPGGEGPT
jgi:hypothetical protein